MESLKFKNFEILDHKADGSGNLVITGYGAVFGNVDSYGDVIEKGAFSEVTIKIEKDSKGQLKGSISKPQ